MLHQGKHRHLVSISSLNRERVKINSQNDLWESPVWSAHLEHRAEIREMSRQQGKIKSLWTATHTFLFHIPCSCCLSHTAHGWSHSQTEVFWLLHHLQMFFSFSPPPFNKTITIFWRAYEGKMNKSAFKDSRPSSAEPLVTVQDTHASLPQPALKSWVGTHSCRQTRPSSSSSSSSFCCCQQKQERQSPYFAGRLGDYPRSAALGWCLCCKKIVC